MLSSLMEVQHYEDNPRSMIMVDFFYYNLHFARMRGLSLDATSALFSILKMVFEAAFGKDRAQVTYLPYFQTLHRVDWIVPCQVSSQVSIGCDGGSRGCDGVEAGYRQACLLSPSLADDVSLSAWLRQDIVTAEEAYAVFKAKVGDSHGFLYPLPASA
jgi:hypothetical protein